MLIHLSHKSVATDSPKQMRIIHLNIEIRIALTIANLMAYAI